MIRPLCFWLPGDRNAFSTVHYRHCVFQIAFGGYLTSILFKIVPVDDRISKFPVSPAPLEVTILQEWVPSFIILATISQVAPGVRTVQVFPLSGTGIVLCSSNIWAAKTVTFIVLALKRLQMAMVWLGPPYKAPPAKIAA
jgi:hypothetical protein